MTGPTSEPSIWWPGSLTLLLVGLAGVLAGLILGTGFGASAPQTLQRDSISIVQCTKETLVSLELKQAPTTELLDRVLDHCYSFARSENLITDFKLRKLTFIQQYQDNGILIWVVVLVTICGVGLAGLQIFSSYQLAAADRRDMGESTELILKRDQVILKSSVTGLFILLLSLGFFLVFVFYVFRFEKWDDDAGHGPPQGTTTVSTGGLGPPPTQKGSAAATPDH